MKTARLVDGNNFVEFVNVSDIEFQVTLQHDQRTVTALVTFDYDVIKSTMQEALDAWRRRDERAFCTELAVERFYIIELKSGDPTSDAYPGFASVTLDMKVDWPQGSATVVRFTAQALKVAGDEESEERKPFREFTLAYTVALNQLKSMADMMLSAALFED